MTQLEFICIVASFTLGVTVGALGATWRNVTELSNR
jgi:hypothetical protein